MPSEGRFLMAAGTLPKPGSTVGPCAEACGHLDCLETRKMAADNCHFCQTEIGYDRRFYLTDNGLCHATCLEERDGR